MSAEKAPVFNYILSFLLVGIAWGGTTPFIRRAARSHKPPHHALLDEPAVKESWLKSKVYGAAFAVFDLLRNPRYAVPLIINLTGSVWFFLLIGQAGMLSLLRGTCHWKMPLPRYMVRSLSLTETGITLAELSLTVPIVNTMAFLFTVLGEWYVEKKVISRGMCSFHGVCRAAKYPVC